MSTGGDWQALLMHVGEPLACWQPLDEHMCTRPLSRQPEW